MATAACRRMGLILDWNERIVESLLFERPHTFSRAPFGSARLRDVKAFSTSLNPSFLLDCCNHDLLVTGYAAVAFVGQLREVELGSLLGNIGCRSSQRTTQSILGIVLVQAVCH